MNTSKIGPPSSGTIFLKQPPSFIDSLSSIVMPSGGSLNQGTLPFDSYHELVRSFLSDPQVTALLQRLDSNFISTLVANPVRAVASVLDAAPSGIKEKYEALTSLTPSQLSSTSLKVLAAPYVAEADSAKDAAAAQMTAFAKQTDDLSSGAFTIAIRTAASTYIRRAIGASLTPELLAVSGAVAAYALTDSKLGELYSGPSFRMDSDRASHLHAVSTAAFRTCNPLIRGMGLALTQEQFDGLLAHTAYLESGFNTSAVNQFIQEAVVTATNATGVGASRYTKKSRRSIILWEISEAIRKKDKTLETALRARLKDADPIHVTGCDPASMYPIGTPGSPDIPSGISSIRISGSHRLATGGHVLPEKFILASTALGMFQLVGSNIANLAKELKLKVKPYTAYVNEPYHMIALEAKLFEHMFRSIASLGIVYNERQGCWASSTRGSKPSGIITIRMIGPMGDLHFAPYAGLLFLLQMAWVNGSACLTDSKARIYHPDRLWNLRGTIHIDEALDKSYSSSDARSKFGKFIIQ